MADTLTMVPEHVPTPDAPESEVRADEPAPGSVGRLDRVVTVAALGIAFVVMASIFSPDWSRAGAAQPGRGVGTPAPRPGATPDASAIRKHWAALSTDPHEGLAMIGELHDGAFTVRMYAAPGGALYSIYDESGEELAVLQSAQQVESRFPELHLRDVRFHTLDEPVHGAQTTTQLLHAGSDDLPSR